MELCHWKKRGKSNKRPYLYADSSVHNIFITLSQTNDIQRRNIIYLLFFFLSLLMINDILTKDDIFIFYGIVLFNYSCAILLPCYYSLIDPWMYTSFTICKDGVSIGIFQRSIHEWSMKSLRKYLVKMEKKNRWNLMKRKKFLFFSQKIIITRIINDKYELLQKYKL